jgi:hypothetical protein
MANDYTMDLDEGIGTYHRATQRAFDRVAAEAQLDMNPPRPTVHGKFFDGRLPENLASLRAAEIAEYYSAMCHFADFVNSKAVQAKAMLVNAEQVIELTKAKIRKSKTGTAGEKEDGVNCDSRYVEANGDWLEAKTYSDILATIAEAAQRDLRFISRIIETKKMEIEMGRRDNAVRRPPDIRGGRHRD